MQLVRLHDEVALLTQLQSTTVQLIHATLVITAIKKLVEAYDILDLNLAISRTYKAYEGNLPLDVCALKDLNRIRCELLVFHQTDFKPPKLVHGYSGQMVSLFHLVNLKEKNSSRRIEVA